MNNNHDNFASLLDDFALIGRNPRCGCPMAIDMEASSAAQREFADKGLLLEFMAAEVAKSLWEEATWPCPHYDSSLQIVA